MKCAHDAAGTLYKKYRAKGLTVIGIEFLENKSSAIGFAKKYRWPFPLGVDDGSAGKNVGLFGVPVHVPIDKSGRSMVKPTPMVIDKVHLEFAANRRRRRD